MNGAPSDYAFLDAGDGRRLERFADLVVDRPAPAASTARREPVAWRGAVTFHPGRGWRDATGAPAELGPRLATLDGLAMDIRLADGGQVGLFPEQIPNASWVDAAIHARVAAGGGRDDPPEVLNLFAYTGLLTLAASKAGAAVVHVDASRPAVQWARRNAELSRLGDRPIRWIVDDALAFVRREARRGRRYAGLVLDPPSYGHGGRGSGGGWQLDTGLLELLDRCAGIAEPDAFWLLTAHTPRWDADRLADALAAAIDAPRDAIDAAPMELIAGSGAVLRLGAVARFDPLAAQ